MISETVGRDRAPRWDAVSKDYKRCSWYADQLGLVDEPGLLSVPPHCDSCHEDADMGYEMCAVSDPAGEACCRIAELWEERTCAS